MDKPIDVGVWHSVWQGKGRWLKPSEAGIDWDLPPSLAPVDVQPLERHARPHVPVPRGVSRPPRGSMTRNTLGKFVRLLDTPPDEA